jgi:protein SCO1/2
LVALLSGSVHATVAAPPEGAAAEPGTPLPPRVKDIGVVEKLNEPIPRELLFTDSDGRPVRLSEVVGQGKPLLLNLVYYRCPMLCGLVLGGLVKSLRETGLKPGEDYHLLTVSIDPTDVLEEAQRQRRGHLQNLGLAADDPSWRFLLGQAEPISALADAVGFEFAYDGQTRQYAHAAVSMVLTPDGRVSRYLYGMEHKARDLRLAVVEAGAGKVGTSFDRLLLTCFKYDPATRRYELFVNRFIQVGGLLIFAVFSTLLGVLWRREFRRKETSR